MHIYGVYRDTLLDLYRLYTKHDDKNELLDNKYFIEFTYLYEINEHLNN